MAKSVAAIVVIPARGGSKRLPRKNIAPLAGRPLISYAISAARRSPWVDEVYVTTEDREIARIAASAGAVVPFLRPAELAGDRVPAVRAVQHLVRSLMEGEHKDISLVVMIQPTSPFVQPGQIDACLEMLANEPGLDSVNTLVEIAHAGHPYNLRTVAEDGYWEFFLPEERARFPLRQDKPAVYRFGNLYAVRREVLLDQGLFGKRRGYVQIDPIHAWDINETWELQVAECLLQKGCV